MPSISPAFSDRMIEMCGSASRAWLAEQPAMLDEFSQRWSLTSLHPPFQLSYNSVVPTIRADGSETVLKLCFPNCELLSEMRALQVFKGHGIAQLLEADFERQSFLLERIQPGVELVTLEDDDQRISIEAQVMNQLWRPALLPCYSRRRKL